MRAFLLLATVALAAPVARAQDPVQVDPKHYSVMLENDQVRILKIHYNPKEKSVMHEHPASVVVFLNASKSKFTLPDGTSTIQSGRAGEVRYSEAGKHLPQNIGTAPLQAVLVELKPRTGGSSPPVSLDPVKVDPTRHKVELENDRVRVLRIKFKPHDKTKEHEHPNGVAIYLTDVKARFTLPDGKTRDGGGKRGEVTWAVGEKHSVANLSAQPADIILVELK